MLVSAWDWVWDAPVSFVLFCTYLVTLVLTLIFYALNAKVIFDVVVVVIFIIVVNYQCVFERIVPRSMSLSF